MQTGAQLARVSPSGLIGFAAVLSVNLAVLNSLYVCIRYFKLFYSLPFLYTLELLLLSPHNRPFPALDGGQLVFVLLELITGRALPRKFQDTVTALAFALLFALGTTTLIGDFGKMGRPLAGFPPLLPQSAPSSIIKSISSGSDKLPNTLN